MIAELISIDAGSRYNAAIHSRAEKIMLIHYASVPSPLGKLTAAAQNDALIGLWFDGQKYFPADTKNWQLAQDHPVLTQLRVWLDGYFQGEKKAFSGKLSPQGSEFRQAVWQILRRIPYGQTTTYGAIARQLAVAQGKPQISAQAVGGAVGHNPISLIIPCHRVQGANGALTGYAGGLDKKQALLELESGIR
ncbi:methylated-DNA--protein-cysteine methyltransferase [Betaproteobacteria bacterium]|nr:methylated-DNA--protein-cysteine methyltransferase [Betaproteobacteria bacterium]GHU48620.1 methylated-DNA--protein-cysteine methyltransferase [Betaproteobacteria bacterium]